MRLCPFRHQLRPIPVCVRPGPSADPAGTPTVDPERCIGCGLCAARCPVAAIHLDPRSAVAVVTPAEANSYVPTQYDPVAFPIDRATIGASFVEEAPPFEDADQVATQLLQLDRAMLSAADAQGAFRLLARNTFLSIGLPARLKNVGDNNAFGELAVGDAAFLWLSRWRRGVMFWMLCVVSFRRGHRPEPVRPRPGRGHPVRGGEAAAERAGRLLPRCVDAHARIGVVVRTLPIVASARDSQPRRPPAGPGPLPGGP